MTEPDTMQQFMFLRPGVIFWREKVSDGYKTQFLDQVSMRSGTIGTIGLDVFRLLNGKLTGNQIIEKIAKKHASAWISEEYVTTQVTSFLQMLNRWNFIGCGDLKQQFQEYLAPLREYNKAHFGTEYRPGLVYWEVTNACNYKCMMCYNFSENPRPRELTLEEGFAAIEQMKAAGTTGIIFTGGEPTMARDKLVRWIECAHRNDIFAELFTNGSLISADYARELQRAGLKYVRVTIHGAKAETHEKISLTPGSFDRAILGMKHLISAGLPVCWQFTACQYNLYELREMLEQAINYGCHGFRAGSLDYMGKGIEQQNVMLDPLDEMILWKGLSESIIVHADKIKIGWGADYCKDEAWEYYVRRPQEPNDESAKDPNIYFKFAKNSLCGIGIRSLAMTAEGDIIPCPTLAEISMGNIRDGNYQQIWDKGEAFVAMRENLLEDFDGCNSCGVRYACCGGCRSLSFKRHGNLTSKDVRRCEAVARREQAATKKLHPFYTKAEVLEGLAKVELVDHRSQPKFHSVLKEGMGPWVPNNEVVLYKLNEDLIRETWQN